MVKAAEYSCDSVYKSSREREERFSSPWPTQQLRKVDTGHGGGLLQSFAALFECRFLVSGLQPGSDDGSGFGPGASAKALGPRSLLALAVSGL